MPRSSDMANHGRIVISKSQLARMKASSVIETPQMIMAKQKAAADERKERNEKSFERKKQMKEKEHQAKMRAPETEEQLVAECRRLAYAEPLTDQERQHDTAKRMYSVKARAAAFKKRTEQIAEKLQAAEAENKYDQFWNRKMEMDRRKDVQARELFEIEKRKKNVAHREKLQQQMDERAHAKMMRAEELEQEKAAQLKKLQKNQEDEIARMQKKRQKDLEIAKDVKLSNEQAQRMRTKQDEDELRSDEMINAYQRQKRLQEAKKEAALLEKKRQDELRTAKLRAQQEKQSDTQAEEDEARAMRATEEAERKARRIEEMELRKAKNVCEQMKRDKKEAEQNKNRLQEIRRQEEAREVAEIKYQLRVAAQEESRKAALQHQAAIQNRYMVQSQMADNETRRFKAKESIRDEARAQTMSRKIEQFKLERILAEETASMQAAKLDTSDISKVTSGY